MKKFITTLATFAIIGGACSGLVEFSPIASNYKEKAVGSGPSIRMYLHNNNKSLFVNGHVGYYIYNFNNLVMEFSEANIDFSLTPAGTTAMVQSYLKAGESAGTFIMHWLDKNLTDFDNRYKYSYLNIVESGNFPSSWATSKDVSVRTDGNAYFDFEDNLGQPFSIINVEVNLYRQGIPLGKTVVRFHYKWNEFTTDDFYVSFKSMVPAARILW